MPDGAQLIRALNVLTVKIIERSEHTRITCAFVRLMKESVANNSLVPKYNELVMKCLWKMIRLLPNWNNDLDLVRLHRDKVHRSARILCFSW
jgi:cytoskeleton-associated protein 5